MSELLSPRTADSWLRDRALRILALRDHSEQELRRKLTAPRLQQNHRQPPEITPQAVNEVIDWCCEQRYLDDNRFARQFIASRSRKGYGVARIRQELKQKGIDSHISESALGECDIDWVALAKAQAQRKYGQPLPTTFPEKAKIQHFLLYRGYLIEDIQQIWRNFTD